jgi:cytochrome c-type biogenesis protein
MMGGLELGVMLAFAGGLLSFLSPCVLPLAPPYLAYLSGQTIEQMTEPGRSEKLLSRLALAALGLMAVAFWRLVATGGEVGPLSAAALAGSLGILGFALAQDPVTRRVFTSALFFVLGLATVFVTLGATASAAGQALLANKFLFAQIAGLVIYVLGQHFIGLRRSLATVAIMLGLWVFAVIIQGGDPVAGLRENAVAFGLLAAVATALQFSGHEHIPFLYREARFDAGRATGGLVGAYVIGLAFAFGWTPCIGPILGTILALAGQQETVGQGVAMLAVYAAGLGLPFLLAALFVRPFMRFMRGFRQHMGKVEAAMGGLLVVVALLMVTNQFEVMSYWLLETFPGLATIG